MTLHKIRKPTICIAAPFPPPYGGMAIQADKLSNALEQSGWQVFRAPVNQHFSSRMGWAKNTPLLRAAFRTAIFLNALNKILNKCNVVYLFSGFFNYFFLVSAPTILLTKARKKRIIMSARGGAAGNYFHRYSTLMRPFIRILDAVTAPSEFLAMELVKTFNIPVKIVPNIVDTHQFKYRERSSFRPNLLFPRNLEPIYNAACAIRAFARIRCACPDAVLSIAGDGSERQSLELLCRNLGVIEAVVFMGQVPHSQMQTVYDSHDILINSSNVDNFPGAIIEAFAAGLPVVTTSAGGIPFIVKHEVTGLLIETDNDNALAESVIRLIQNQPLARRLASEARKTCFEYSSENAVRRLLPIICQSQI